ncbi:hypothetical protein DPEC_G00208850 [Dallia pectoralis]|uniref:Uncharacterized protein n=1 Tax=Dallia pectoralis TaxID=75939 RepID=A0ACC2G5G0_DALPE|nr:hypothetical protein DPEC_G00208850 [Dallia pectoralis]
MYTSGSAPSMPSYTVTSPPTSPPILLRHHLSRPLPSMSLGSHSLVLRGHWNSQKSISTGCVPWEVLEWDKWVCEFEATPPTLLRSASQIWDSGTCSSGFDKYTLTCQPTITQD